MGFSQGKTRGGDIARYMATTRNTAMKKKRRLCFVISGSRHQTRLRKNHNDYLPDPAQGMRVSSA
jgi:hypothetical protein